MASRISAWRGIPELHQRCKSSQGGQRNQQENEKVIKDLSKTDALGIFHASAKTTRGCLSTDDGWIGALLAAYAPTGKLKHVFVELFHHQDPALEPLRKAVKGHGVDTTDGRTYNKTVTDGIIEVTHRLNNLAARKLIK